jgi:hypothetical protein
MKIYINLHEDYEWGSYFSWGEQKEEQDFSNYLEGHVDSKQNIEISEKEYSELLELKISAAELDYRLAKLHGNSDFCNETMQQSINEQKEYLIDFKKAHNL